jgi:hypothetical protein
MPDLEPYGADLEENGSQIRVIKDTEAIELSI